MLPVGFLGHSSVGEAFTEKSLGEGEMVPFVTPRALDRVELPYVVGKYARAARSAMDAGFDGSRFR